MEKTAKIGIIGGSGFYQFLHSVQTKPGQQEEVSIRTPYGEPADKILLTECLGKKIAFLPRHGRQHQYPPHQINYRANLYALKKLGVERIIAPSAVGSLKPNIKPGDFVICHQFIDRTKRRKDTFFDGSEACPSECEAFGRVAHISTAEPFCPALRELAIQSCQNLKLPCHRQGVVVVIEGPRFSTKAESSYYSRIGDVINMTQYPEVVLAKELELCYLNISLVTDYDVGLKGRDDIKTVTAQDVLEMFKKNTEKLKELVLTIIQDVPEQRSCQCKEALKNAFL